MFLVTTLFLLQLTRTPDKKTSFKHMLIVVVAALFALCLLLFLALLNETWDRGDPGRMRKISVFPESG